MAKVKSMQELELENRITIPMYFNKYILPHNKGFHTIDEANNTSICPFHQETDPSWHYWVKHKVFHCFGCGVSGNIIRLHQLTRRAYYGEYLSYEDSINQLIAIYGLQDVIKQIEATIAEVAPPKTAFEKAREQIMTGMDYRTSPDKITLSTYRTRNQQIITSQSSLETKLTEFSTLDMLAGLILREEVIN